MMDEKPRKVWYSIECEKCGTPRNHAEITDGMCPDCRVEALDQKLPLPCSPS